MQPMQYAAQPDGHHDRGALELAAASPDGAGTSRDGDTRRRRGGDAGDGEGRGVPGSAERDAHFEIGRTWSALTDALERALRPHGLTSAQYNVLGILRSAGPDGLCRNALRERLPSRMPDVTRLLDRMEVAGFVTRERSPRDRRLVTTRITPRGLELANALDDAVRDEHVRRLGHLAPDKLRTLVELLALVRAGVEPVAPRPRR